MLLEQRACVRDRGLRLNREQIYRHPLFDAHRPDPSRDVLLFASNAVQFDGQK
jgi:hypothetical protein